MDSLGTALALSLSWDFALGGRPMAKPLLTDDLRQRIEPLLPPPKPRRLRFPGRKPLTHRRALTGVSFILKTGLNWNDLPQELRCGPGSRCRRRLAGWQQAGAWVRPRALLLAGLQGAGKIDWSRASADSSFARALGGGEQTGPSPTGRGKRGTKHHAVAGAGGAPLAATATAANAPDIKGLLGVVDQTPGVRGRPGRPRRRPGALYGDRAYDSQPHREALRDRGTRPELARRSAEHGSGPGVFRWVVGRSFSRLRRLRKKRWRTGWTASVHDALLKLARS
jgi:transposase